MRPFLKITPHPIFSAKCYNLGGSAFGGKNRMSPKLEINHENNNT